jgi:predicted dehydrogenase
MASVRWAVVGTSAFALDWIARGITTGSNATLAAVVSRDPARAAAAAARCGAPRWYTSIEAIDRADVDAVFLVLPNHQHAPQAIAAAQRGLHVVVEKPMAPSVAACEAMIAAAAGAGVMLAVAHCMEWAPPIVRAGALIADGAIGEVLNARITASFDYPPSGAWRQDDTTEAGGGPLMDMGVHAIDAITRLLGPVAQVTALLERRRYAYAAEDSATLLLRFASGAHGTVMANFTCLQNELEIQGTTGRLLSRAWWGRDFAGDLRLQRGASEEAIALEPVLVYTPQIEHLSDAILRGVPPVTRGERGLAAMRVVAAAIHAARTGQTTDVA